MANEQYAFPNAAAVPTRAQWQEAIFRDQYEVGGYETRMCFHGPDVGEALRRALLGE